MKHLITLLTIFLSFTLSAQCDDFTDNCPENLAYNLKEGETDTMFIIPPPDTSACGTANLFHTIVGPAVLAGRGVPGAFTFQDGISELTYQYSESRFGNFTQDATLLPDGNGTEYEVPFNVSANGPGQTVGEAGGLTRICIIMEHSYLGDLDMWITCPDGSSANLHEYSNSDNVFRQLLGQGDQNTNTPDPGDLYCWSVTAPRTMVEHIDMFNVGSNQSMPSIDYRPAQSLSRFDTCQASGEWILHVRDNLANDNGSVSSVFADFGENFAPSCVQEIKINQPRTSVFDPTSSNLSLRAYPNPVSDQFTVEATAVATGSGQLEVYASTGELLLNQVASLSPGENIFIISSTDWPAGVYSVRITDGSSERRVKIIKVR